MIQYKPRNELFDIVYYNGDKIRKFRKYENKIYNNDNYQILEQKKNINVIVTESNELNDRGSPIFMILMMFILWSFFQSYYYFFVK